MTWLKDSINQQAWLSLVMGGMNFFYPNFLLTRKPNTRTVTNNKEVSCSAAPSKLFAKQT